MDLSYPFRIYPMKSNNVFTPYINHKYTKNIKTLYQDLESLCYSLDNNHLVIFVIGSLIDEQSDKVYSINSHYQHLPVFVKKHMENNDTPVKIICISPKLESDNIPVFIKKSMNEFQWYKYDELKYTSSLYNLTYDFYHTLFPEYIENDFVNIQNQDYYLKKNNKYLRLPKLYYRNSNYKLNYDVVEDYYNNKVLKLKNNVLDHFYDIYKSSSSENDKMFVNIFLEKCELLVKKLQSVSGSLLILNYAVFCDNWICASYFYFFESFYKKIKDYPNIKILNYDFIQNISDQLIDYNKKSYGYENTNIILEIKRNGRLKISDDVYEKKIIKKLLKIDNLYFQINKINGDGDCLFNSILKQSTTNLNLTVFDARKIIVQEIEKNEDIKKLLKEEILTMSEYNNISLNKIDETLQLHLYFIKEGPYCEQADKLRQNLNLPFSVFYGGNCEIGILGKLLNINIKIINYDNKIIDIMDNIYDKDIFIKFYGDHYDIATLQDDNNNLNSHYEYNTSDVHNIMI